MITIYSNCKQNQCLWAPRILSRTAAHKQQQFHCQRWGYFHPTEGKALITDDQRTFQVQTPRARKVLGEWLFPYLPATRDTGYSNKPREHTSTWVFFTVCISEVCSCLKANGNTSVQYCTAGATWNRLQHSDRTQRWSNKATRYTCTCHQQLLCNELRWHPARLEVFMDL